MCLRVRPLGLAEEASIQVRDTTSILFFPNQTDETPAPTAGIRYTFSKVFDQDCPQAGVFQETALPLVRDCIQGKNALLFTYGITGSGKTHTMQGSLGQPGMLPRPLSLIFASIRPSMAPRFTFERHRSQEMLVMVRSSSFLRESWSAFRLFNKRNPDSKRPQSQSAVNIAGPMRFHSDLTLDLPYPNWFSLSQA